VGADAEVANLTGRIGGLLLAGPRAGTILSAIDDRATSEDGAIADAARTCTLNLAPARVIRARAGGREAFEIHTPMEHLRRIFLALLEAGAGEGLRLVGARALNALRLEQGSPAWGAELTRAVDPFSAGLETAIDLAKPDFRGRDAILARSQSAPEKRLVLLELDDEAQWDPIGAEPVRGEDGSLVGATTSAGYGHTVGRRLALAFLDAAVARDGFSCDVIVLGESCRARVLGP
jgi:glycine cleavage system aminomethyltransferase T